MKTEKIYTQHEENKEWTSNLSFHKGELKAMEQRLEEIASKNTSKALLAQVEHFQNQMIIQKDQISRINHEINLSNDAINNEIKRNSTAVDHRSIRDHAPTREHIKAFESIFSSFKSDFHVFLSKTL